MKTTTRSIHRVFVICFWLITSVTAACEPSSDTLAILRDMQGMLDQQNQRIERLYKAVEPFLDELEREGQQLEQQQERAKEQDDPAFNESVYGAFNTGD